MKPSIITAILSGGLCTMVSAATLATPDFDTDSYIFFGTNNEFNPQITLGESLQGSP